MLVKAVVTAVTAASMMSWAAVERVEEEEEEEDSRVGDPFRATAISSVRITCPRECSALPTNYSQPFSYGKSYSS